MTADRTEALALLAAADDHDRANGVVRIRLDEQLARKIVREIGRHNGQGWTAQAHAVLDMLQREAL